VDFELEDFVPLFTRDTVTWNAWGWETRAVFPSLIRKVDKRGRIEWSQRWSAARAVAEVIRFPEMIVEPALIELQDCETIETGERWLLVVNHEKARKAIEAVLQGQRHASAMTDAERSRLYRERRKSGGRVTNRHENRDASRDAVTNRDGSLPPPSSPSLPSVSPLEPLFHSPPILSLPPLSPIALAREEREPAHSVETAEEAAARAPSLFAEPVIEARPKRRGPRLARADVLPDGLAEHFLAELRAACQTVNRRGPKKVGEKMLDELRKLYAECEPTREEISHVVAVRAEMTRRGEGYGHLTWESICVPSNFNRWLSQPIRPPPGGSGPRGGRIEPGPRPTETKVVNLRELAARKQES